MHFAAKLKVPVHSVATRAGEFDVVGCDAAQAPCLQRSAANAVCIPGNRAKGVGNGFDDDVTAVVVQ
jgi:hypothetical protein